jgi:hypothetical protein
VDPAFAEFSRNRPVDDGLQPAPVDRELRHIETRIHAARLPPDLLAEAVHVDELFRADGHAVERLQQIQRRQFADRMRQRVDADAKLADLGGLFEDFGLDAAPFQHQRQRQSAHTSACDQYLHGQAALRISLVGPSMAKVCPMASFGIEKG